MGLHPLKDWGRTSANSPNSGEPLKCALALTFRDTNNEAEYETWITCLSWPKK